MAEIKRIIFDTDIGEDPDDAVALAYMLEAERKGLCSLIGITTCSKTPYGAECAGAICRWYGKNDMPIGQLPLDAEVTPDNIDDIYPAAYGMAVAKKFGGGPSYFKAPGALETLVKLLRGSDGPVTIVATGKLTNIKTLLGDPEGYELVRDKVCEIDIMGCDFAHQADPSLVPHPEYNIAGDVGAARFICGRSPVPVVFSPFEMSEKELSGRVIVERYGEDHPTGLALIRLGCGGGRSSWDPSTALYAVEGERGVMRLSPWGNVSFRDDGVSDFTPGEGKCRYLIGTGDIAGAIDAMFA